MLSLGEGYRARGVKLAQLQLLSPFCSHEESEAIQGRAQNLDNEYLFQDKNSIKKYL